MIVLRIGEAGEEQAVVRQDGRHYSLTSLGLDIDAAFWESGRDRVSQALAEGSLPEIDIEGQRIGSPIVRPGSVVCIGQNYAAHAAESGAEPPELPIMFFKPSNTVAGPFDDVKIPRDSRATDWEVELGIVIGATAYQLESPTSAMACVGGYVTANDLSERDFQVRHSGGQWSKGKSLPGYCPVGPTLVTSDAIDPGNLRMRSFVNGQPRQDSTTADMIFDVGTIVHHLSQYMRLDPGDLILTGTPEGVAMSGRFPYLHDGDTVDIEIEGLGRQRQLYLQP